jgi:hypothetical protein
MTYRKIFWLTTLGLGIIALMSSSQSIAGKPYVSYSTITLILGMASLVVVPKGLENIAFWILPLWVPLGFTAWCWPLQRGTAWFPLRSLVLFGAIILLTLLSFRDIGPYRSELELIWTLSGNLALVFLTSLSAFWFRHCPSPLRGLIYHSLLFFWLATYAIPFLGIIE